MVFSLLIVMGSDYNISWMSSLYINGSFTQKIWLLFFGSLMTIWFVGIFKGLAVCRRQEKEADLFAIKQSGNGEFLISALTKLTEGNKQKADIHPIRKWLLTHPTLNDRIKYIRSL
jgi:Zn-dependent protease with chaperone function